MPLKPAWRWPALLASITFSTALQADTLSQGQAVAGQFLRGEIDTVWSAMTPDMQQALGSLQSLRAVREDLRKAFGSEAQVLAETERGHGSLTIYARTARWTEASIPVLLEVSFNADQQIAGLWVKQQPVAAPSRHLDYQTQAQLRLPVDGAWHVYWGGRDIENNYHAMDGGQRFAIDLVRMRDARTHTGDATVLANYHCWDQPILSPAEGTVVSTVGDLPDQPIGSTDPHNPAGNHVVLDLGNSEYAFLGHLRQGSLAVAPGEHVTPGQEVGRCGNSGNTSEPHLHFHLQNTPRLGMGAGLPAQFIDYRADGQDVARGEPEQGQRIKSAR